MGEGVYSTMFNCSSIFSIRMTFLWDIIYYIFILSFSLIFLFFFFGARFFCILLVRQECKRGGDGVWEVGSVLFFFGGWVANLSRFHVDVVVVVVVMK